VWADDAVAFEVAGADVTAMPLAFTLRLRPATTEFYGVGADAELVEAAEPEHLRAVCVLERVENTEAWPRVERLAGAEAFPAALAHAYCFSLADEARKARMTSSYLELVERVPVFRVRLPTGLERLQPLLDEIEETVEFGAAAA
jgi:hypothetical protein